MNSKTRAIIFLVLGLMLLCFAGGMIWGIETTPSKDELLHKALEEHDILDGSTLRSMMNEAKLSPGLANGYANKYPTYAWLFDNSFVTYIE